MSFVWSFEFVSNFGFRVCNLILTWLPLRICARKLLNYSLFDVHRRAAVEAILGARWKFGLALRAMELRFHIQAAGRAEVGTCGNVLIATGAFLDDHHLVTAVGAKAAINGYGAVTFRAVDLLHLSFLGRHLLTSSRHGLVDHAGDHHAHTSANP